MRPISSMWPASMIVGEPAALTVAMLVPARSARTSAKVRARSRHSWAGAVSNPDGPGVSRSVLRNVTASGESTVGKSSERGERRTADHQNLDAAGPGTGSSPADRRRAHHYRDE